MIIYWLNQLINFYSELNERVLTNSAFISLIFLKIVYIGSCVYVYWYIHSQTDSIVVCDFDSNK